jgi:hypothetical protein
MKIKLLIRNVNMGNGHLGLAALARKFKVDLEKIDGQDVVMFLNTAGDKLKIVGAKGTVIGYLRMPKGRRIYLEAIQWLPQTFHASGRIDYDSALKKALKSARLAIVIP